jgi:hypothetical protein
VEVEIIIGIVLVGTELDFIATSVGMIAPNQTSRICGRLTSDMLDSHSVVVVLTVNVGSEFVVIIISDEDVF